MAQLCEVCAQQPRKYKCPACELPICSLLCSKAHQEICKVTERPVVSADTDKAAIPTAPTKQIQASLDDRFEQLAKSAELDALLQRYPLLKQQLASIYEATLGPPQTSYLPPRGQHRGYRGGSFRGGDRGRFSNTSRGPWTQQTGDKAALRLIKQARESGDEDYGQGLIEFLSLVQTKCCSDAAGVAEASAAPSLGPGE